jgi:transcription elongation factor GreA-like protein
VIVHTNDPDNPRINLSVLGDVVFFVVVQPPMVSLRGAADQELKAAVDIVQQAKYPFTIVNSYTLKKGLISHSVAKSDNGFRLVVENLSKTVGEYSDRIFLQTDSPFQKEIVIKVFGKILPSQKTGNAQGQPMSP